MPNPLNWPMSMSVEEKNDNGNEKRFSAFELMTKLLSSMSSGAE